VSRLFAAVAVVETDTFRGPARHLCGSVGFTLHYEAAGYVGEH
jgi:hypothetical protein